MNAMMSYGNYGAGYGNYGAGYGSYGGGYGTGYPAGYPGVGGFAPGYPQQGGGEYQQTMQDSYTGGMTVASNGGLFGGFRLQPREGFGLDFNGNGRYDRGRDGVLMFDINGDGKYNRKDVQGTNDMMQAAVGNFDFNNDGKISMQERIKGSVLRSKFQQLDTNRDGRLDSHEMARGGGRVWMDSDQNGRVGRNETSSVFSVPANGRFGPTERLDYVDPFQGSSHTSGNSMGYNPNPGPFGGGGYPGCGCGGYGGGGYGYGNPGYRSGGVY